MRSIGKVFALLLVTAALPACSQKGPAATAIEAAEDALAAVHEQAQKYVPGQYAEVKTLLDEGRQAFREERFAEAIEIVRDVPARARELGEAATAARERLAAQIAVDWERLQESLPELLSGLESRLAELGKARRLPEGVAELAIEDATSGLEVARQAWEQASGAFESGNLEGALARALESERLVRELMESVGMQPAQTAPPAS